VIRTFQYAALLALCLLGPVGLVNGTESGGTTTVEGTLLDSAGVPLSRWRVVVRAVAATDVFISPPSDPGGRYSVSFPSAGPHVIVALIAPSGARVALPEPESIPEHRARVSLDLRVSVSREPGTRPGVDRLAGADRLFLSFVEDPALVGRQYWEGRLASALENRAPNVSSVRLTAAFTFESLPGVEVGVRAGYGEIHGGGSLDDNGTLDLDLWGKCRLDRSATGRWELAAGALMKLPTGDEDAGLGSGATQSELFVAASRSFSSAVVIGHVGVVTSEDGTSVGAPLDGRLAASSGLGVVVPLTSAAGLVFEASYDGARFDESNSASRVLTGFNWQLDRRARLRAALAAGLGGASADAELTVGCAVAF
jgi:hypothetical protein